MKINQGDLFWLQLEEPGFLHPHVIIQDDAINHSRIDTVVVCALTSNIKRVSEPGNILLEPGEGNLERQSVILVSKISSVNKTRLTQYIGSLSQERIQQIYAGLRFLQSSFLRPKP